MTLLYLGLQDSMRDYYLSDGRVSDSIMKNNIDKFSKKYPTHPHLYESINVLTNPDPKLRNANFGQYSEVNEYTHFNPDTNTYYTDNSHPNKESVTNLLGG